MMKKLFVVLIFVFLVFTLMTTAQNEKSEAKNCSEKEHRQFDFWLGDWSIKQKILKADGKWFEADAETSVKPALDGCALVENWSGEVLFFWEGMKTPETIKGLSVRAYNAKTKKWTINWMDTRGLEFGAHAGGFTESKGEFFRTVKNPDGNEMKTRITFSDITKSSVHWDLAVSSDSGETWRTLWIMAMTRK